jgi:hypothetical protein
VLYNLTDGIDVEAKVSDPLNPVGPVPVVDCVAPRQVSLDGGDVVVLSGANFLAGASVQFGRVPAAAVSVISPERIEAIAPAVSKPGERGLIVVQSAANGAQSSLDCWQMVKFT